MSKKEERRKRVASAVSQVLLNKGAAKSLSYAACFGLSRRKKPVTVIGILVAKAVAKVLHNKAYSKSARVAAAKHGTVGSHPISDINIVVRKAIAVSIGKKVEDIELNANLTTDLNLDNYELSYINHVLTKNFGINAWTDIWETAEMPEDIINIIKRLCNEYIAKSKDLISKYNNVTQLPDKK